MIGFEGTFWLLPLLTASAFAAPTPDALQACGDVAAALPDQVSYSDDPAYVAETSSYWSLANREVRPACVVFPTSATDVASVVNVLNEYTTVHFAVKSGGHDPNPGHATVQDGILISMRDIKGATYDAATNIASVGPGGEWNDVIGNLEPHGVTIVGGRLGVVGVGGYLLQGGISFLSAQYGLAADSVVGWETVMANGSVVNVDAATHPDLAVAMRGSGSQFGVVTQFKVQAHPIATVWGGLRLYAASEADVLFSALHNLVANGADDPKAAVIHTAQIAAAGLAEPFVVYYFYDGEEVPPDSPLQRYLDIPYVADLTGPQTYSALLRSNGAPVDLFLARVSFRTYTIPYIPSNPTIYATILNKWAEITSPYIRNPLHLNSLCTADFQLLPSIVGQHSEERGGNAMGLSGSDPDRLIIELQCAWSNPVDDGELYELSREMTSWLDESVPVWLAQDGRAGNEDAYLPFFMNDAQLDQNVTGSYRDYAKFRALQREVDPLGLFSERAGGFKY